MSVVATAPAITGPLFQYVVYAGTALGAPKTGEEYIAYHYFTFARFESWGIEIPSEAETSEAEWAARLASRRPHVQSAPLAAPELTGNLVADVRTVTGLTNQQLSDLFDVSERRVAGWRQHGDIPSHRAEILEALRAVGLTLYGGLGAQGVARWLHAGEPSPLQLVKRGESEAVRERVRDFRDSTAS